MPLLVFPVFPGSVPEVIDGPFDASNRGPRPALVFGIGRLQGRLQIGGDKLRAKPGGGRERIAASGDSVYEESVRTEPGSLEGPSESGMVGRIVRLGSIHEKNG